VYIREAHALDSRSPLSVESGGPMVEDPVTQSERNQLAEVCMTKLALEPMPALVDDMDDTVNADYAAWPERLFLIGKDGKIVYSGGPGPFQFEPDELDEAIAELLGLEQ
jgi:Iodothyronine deiodinase